MIKMKKRIILLAIFVLSMSIVSAAPIQYSSFVGGDVSLFTEGLSVKVYCDNRFVEEFSISAPGTFFVPIPFCFGTLRGDLYFDGNMIESVNARGNGRGFALMFRGVAQTPVFGAIGATIAGLGSLAIYAKKRRKSN